MDEVTQDVNTETTETSSVENTAEVSQESQTDQSGSSEDKKVSESVPYERFSEINNKNKALSEEKLRLEGELKALREARNYQPPQPQSQQDLAQQQQEQLIREQLKKMGFMDQTEVEAKLKQIEEDQKLDNTMRQLEMKYSGKDGRPQFRRREILQYAKDNQIGNLEAAYKLKYQAELIDHAIKTATGKTKPVKSESSDGSGSQNAGTTDKDLVAAAKKGDRDSLRSFIKRLI